MRASQRVLLVALALVALAAVAMPAGAAPGVGASVQGISPHLTSGFPCQATQVESPALDALQQYAGAAADNNYNPCVGDINPGGAAGVGNLATFAGVGRTAAGEPYALQVRGTLTGNYTYSEPCQETPAGREAGTGEARGLQSENLGTPTSPIPGGLTISGTGAGVINGAPVTNASVTVDFYWSRVGLTAIVGVRNVTLVVNGVNKGSDPAARGLAAAAFIPAQSPNCNAPSVPAAGAINIYSGTITAGSPA